MLYHLNPTLEKVERAFRLLNERKKRKHIESDQDAEVEPEEEAEVEPEEEEELSEISEDVHSIESDDEVNEKELEAEVKEEGDSDDEETELEKRREKRRRLRQKKAEEKRKIAEMRKNMSPKEKQDELKRTIFIGNIPVGTEKKKLEKHFSQYGKIIASRFRDIPLLHPGSKETRKKGVIKKDFHPERKSMNAYIVYEDQQSAQNALQANGTTFQNFHIRVDFASNELTSKDDIVNSVFLSNLPFGTEEEDLHQMFSKCGKIIRIRVIRDAFYKACKGFAYIKFDDENAVSEALSFHQKIVYRDKKVHVARAIKDPKAIKSKAIKLKREQANKEEGKSVNTKKRKSFDPKKLQEKYKNKKRKMAKK